jgi:hypothetical protein
MGVPRRQKQGTAQGGMRSSVGPHMSACSTTAAQRQSLAAACICWQCCCSTHGRLLFSKPGRCNRGGWCASSSRCRGGNHSLGQLPFSFILHAGSCGGACERAWWLRPRLQRRHVWCTRVHTQRLARQPTRKLPSPPPPASHAHPIHAHCWHASSPAAVAAAVQRRWWRLRCGSPSHPRHNRHNRHNT